MNDFDPVRRPSFWAALRHGLGSIGCDIFGAFVIAVVFFACFYTLEYMLTNYPAFTISAGLLVIAVGAVAWRALGWYEIEEQRLFDEQMREESSQVAKESKPPAPAFPIKRTRRES